MKWDLDDSINDHLKELRDAFEDATQHCPEMPIPGDKLVLNAGLLNRGHLWIRIEAICVAVADNSAKVVFNQHGRELIEWIHPSVIVDNLGQPKE